MDQHAMFVGVAVSIAGYVGASIHQQHILAEPPGQLFRDHAARESSSYDGIVKNGLPF